MKVTEWLFVLGECEIWMLLICSGRIVWAEKRLVMFLCERVGTVSQIWSLICFFSIVIMRAPNSTPMVRSEPGGLIRIWRFRAC